MPRREKQNQYTLPRPIGDYLKKLLGDNDSQGKKAFIKLCSKGCDQGTLAELLTFFASPSSITISSTPEDRIKLLNKIYDPDNPACNQIPKSPSERARKNEEDRGDISYQVSLRPLDSWETALEGFEPLGLKGNKRTKFERYLKRLLKKPELSDEDLSFLHSIPLVEVMMLEADAEDGLSSISPKETFRLAYCLDSSAKRLIQIILDRMKQSGPQYKPEYTRLRTKIHLHIYNSTGGHWYDALFADIHNALFPDPGSRIYEDSVRNWRFEHGLVGRKVSGVTKGHKNK